LAEDRTFDALQTLIPMAQGGDPAAQYELAGFYHYGYVGANDFAKALKWYRASAPRVMRTPWSASRSCISRPGRRQGLPRGLRLAQPRRQYMSDKQALAKIKRIRDGKSART